MVQMDLFDRINRKIDKVRNKAKSIIARHSDPETSKAAAAHIEPNLSATKQRCLAVLNGSMTASEIGRDATVNGGNAETHRKRVGELHRDGLIESCGTRVCTVTGINAAVYRRVGT